MNIHGILLAAGESSRFEGNKLHYDVGSGKPLAAYAAEKLISVLPESVAVISDHDRYLYNLYVDLGFKVTAPKSKNRLMSESLKSGVVFSGDPDAWLIVLADMPFIGLKTFHHVVEKAKLNNKIIVPRYNGKMGHPVSIPGFYKDDILALTGDFGAKSIIKNNSDNVIFTPVSDEFICTDIDCYDDLDSIISC